MRGAGVGPLTYPAGGICYTPRITYPVDGICYPLGSSPGLRSVLRPGNKHPPSVVRINFADLGYESREVMLDSSFGCSPLRGGRAPHASDAPHGLVSLDGAQRRTARSGGH